MESTVLTVSPESGEGENASSLKILGAGSSRETKRGGSVTDLMKRIIYDSRSGLSNGWLRYRDSFRAVDQSSARVTGDCQLRHGSPEVVLHENLIVDHGLPLASSERVTGKTEIGLETHLTLSGERRFDFTGVVCSSGESSTFQQNFEEDLSVEGEWSRIEGNSLDGRVNMISTSDGVRYMENL